MDTINDIREFNSFGQALKDKVDDAMFVLRWSKVLSYQGLNRDHKEKFLALREGLRLMGEQFSIEIQFS